MGCVGQVKFHVVSRGVGGGIGFKFCEKGGGGGGSSKIWLMDRNFSPPPPPTLNDERSLNDFKNWGRNDLGETTTVEDRGETTRGGNVLGRNVLLPIQAGDGSEDINPL